MQRSELEVVLERLASVAAEAALPHFRTPTLLARNKAGAGDFDPVTEADIAAERAMRAVLAEMRPDDGVLGEEVAPTTGTSGMTWVLDPIDGTRAFISGIPLWGTLVALNAGAGPIAGMISQPYIGERFIGGLGPAVLHRPGEPARPLSVRGCAALKDAILISTFPEIGSSQERAAFETVSARCRLTRYGTDCYGYALLASGQVDLVIEAGLQTYDIQAPQAVVEAAGGIVTAWDGGPAHHGGRVIAAGDRRIHDAALKLLAQVTG